MKIMLHTNNHLGDVVIMSAVIANLKACYPDIEFGIDTKPCYMDVFNNNPFISYLNPYECDYNLECVYAPFSQRTANGGSCIKAFTRNAFNSVNMVLGRNEFCMVKTTADLYPEKTENKYGEYCIINANCQKCSETKAYPWYQDIVDSRPDIKFIQIGGAEERDITSDLTRVIDLRGKTTVKELIALTMHAKWVISPPSAVVHIASAFPNVKTIVLSGAREPVELTQYPNTTHLTSVCVDGWHRNKGCMKFFMRKIDSRTCERAIIEKGRKYPQCMHRIKKEDVCALLN